VPPESTDRCPVPGVREIDHTADLGLELHADDLRTLFGRAAAGTVWLLFGAAPDEVVDGLSSDADAPEEARSLSLSAPDLPSLLRAWLREVVFWQETEGWVARTLALEASIAAGSGGRDGEGPAGRGDEIGGGDDGGGDADGVAPTDLHLRGTVRGGPTRRDPLREIKGVTRHGLAVEPRDDGWFARVIFDV